MATAENRRRPIGQILLDGGFIARQDLELALEVQKHSNELLGQVLVNMGILDKADLAAALSIQDHLSTLDDAVKSAAGIRKMLGSLLLLTGRITTEQLDFALEEQKVTGGKLGDILVKMGLLTESEVNSVLQFQKNQESAGNSPSPLRLGELLVSSGSITRDQLTAALQKQQLSNRRLGEVLVAEGYAHLHQVDRGIHLQRKLLRAVIVAVISLAGLSMQGCGDSSSYDGDDRDTDIAAVSYASPETQILVDDLRNNIKTNYLQITDSDYTFATSPNFYYSTDNHNFWSIQANIAQSLTDINSRTFIRIDIQKVGAKQPRLNRTFSFETGGKYERFPGNFYLLDGQQSTRKKVESGTISFTRSSVMSRNVSGSFDVIVTDYDSGTTPVPRYSLKGVFSFKMGGYGPAA